MRIIIINGPNLNLLGVREPEIYGILSFSEFIPKLRRKFALHIIDYFQTNHEGVIIDKIQNSGFHYDAMIINPGAYSHTSIAIADALRAIPSRKVEVHLSDISKREAYRHHSFTAEACEKTIMGMGMKGYEEAVDYLIKD